MRPTGNRRNGIRGLIALLESPAIGDSSEGTRNELRIVNIAKPREYLVLVTPVEVHPHVKRVAVFIPHGRVCIVAGEGVVGRRREKAQELNRVGIKPAGGKVIE